MGFMNSAGQAFSASSPAGYGPQGFTPGNTGNLGLIYGLGSAMSALGDIAGGFSQNASGASQAAMYNAQAGEALREAMAAAKAKAREVGEFQSQQVMDYVHSGVIIEGSPVRVLERTRKLGQQEVDAIVASGKAQARLYAMQGAMAKNGARNSLIGSIFKAGMTGLNGYMNAKRIGLYGNATNAAQQLNPIVSNNPAISPETGGFDSSFG